MKTKTTWKKGFAAALVVAIAYAALLAFDADRKPSASAHVSYGSDMAFNSTSFCSEEDDIISITAVLAQERRYLPKNTVSETTYVYADFDLDSSGTILLKENEFSDCGNLKLYLLCCQDLGKLALVSCRNREYSLHTKVESDASNSQRQALRDTDGHIWNAYAPELEQAGWTSLRPLLERIAELIVGIALVAGAFKTGKVHVPFSNSRRSIRHICNK